MTSGELVDEKLECEEKWLRRKNFTHKEKKNLNYIL
jgi:hypothetical protein